VSMLMSNDIRRGTKLQSIAEGGNTVPTADGGMWL
jgi:hypothetical protein